MHRYHFHAIVRLSDAVVLVAGELLISEDDAGMKLDTGHEKKEGLVQRGTIDHGTDLRWDRPKSGRSTTMDRRFTEADFRTMRVSRWRTRMTAFRRSFRSSRGRIVRFR
jgi:hypothetical protein